METTQKRSHTRHFPYQHPTFGTKNRPKTESAWKKSVYYWWWAYLKRNAEYLTCCEKGGKGKLSNLYADFDDVRGDDFKAWWTNGDRGARLFAEPLAEDGVRVLQMGEVFTGDTKTLVVSFPLNLPKKFLEKRFRAILATQHMGKRGHQHAKKSQAKYQFNGQPNLEGLELTLAVYDFRSAHPEMTLWEIGNALPKFMVAQKIKPSDKDSTDKRNVLAASVSRYLRKAKSYIEATGRGCFLSGPPSDTPKSV